MTTDDKIKNLERMFQVMAKSQEEMQSEIEELNRQAHQVINDAQKLLERESTLLPRFLIGVSIFVIAGLLLVLLTSCVHIDQNPDTLNEEQAMEYYECVEEGEALLECWCHAKFGYAEKKVDECKEIP